MTKTSDLLIEIVTRLPLQLSVHEETNTEIVLNVDCLFESIHAVTLQKNNILNDLQTAIESLSVDDLDIEESDDNLSKECILSTILDDLKIIQNHITKNS